MPGIDFRRARQEVRLSEVLSLLGFKPSECKGEQLRGPCPVHRSQTVGSRSFAAHVGKGVWQCFVCQTGGNALDLWECVTGLPLHAAVLDLCQRLGREVPWLHREQRQHRQEQEKQAMREF